MSIVYIGLGSNLGNRRLALNKACDAITALDGVDELTLSKVYETTPVGPQNQGKFLNAAAQIITDIEPIELRREFAEIETRLGRPDKSARIHWGPRIIDIDILLYDDQIINHPELTVPHPQMARRRFVLEPLADLAPDLKHPATKKTISQMLHELC